MGEYEARRIRPLILWMGIGSGFNSKEVDGRAEVEGDDERILLIKLSRSARGDEISSARCFQKACGVNPWQMNQINDGARKKAYHSP